MKQINRLYYPISLADIEPATAHRLRNIGLTEGCEVKVIRLYPFNGPIIIGFDNQQLGIRRSLFKKLVGLTP